MGSKVRDNHHHTIFEAGYEYFINVIDEIIKKHGDYINYTNYGFANVHNKKCYKIGLNVINYKIINYTVKNNENLTSIAKKMLINDYKILELNPSISDYYTVKPGQIIKIPNIYAQKMTLFIDTETFLPVQIDIYDEIGLYASYKYLNVIVNQPFDPKEFTVEYKDYHFYR